MKHHDNMEATLKVRKDLLTLQKELLNYLKDIFEKENARSVAPAEWLQVIMVSHRYIWLRELTSLIADIDLLTELQEITTEQAALARFEIDRLFFTSDPHSEFAKHYKHLLATGAPFMVAHGHLKEATQKLPHSKHHPTAEEALAARKIWHEEHKNQSRKRRS